MLVCVGAGTKVDVGREIVAVGLCVGTRVGVLGGTSVPSGVGVGETSVSGVIV